MFPRRRTHKDATVPHEAPTLDPVQVIDRRNVIANPASSFAAQTGELYRCEAGQPAEPIGCDRHRDHHYCQTCEGWFGVPHDGIHSGPHAHPWRGGDRGCVCLPCKVATGRAKAPVPTSSDLPNGLTVTHTDPTQWAGSFGTIIELLADNCLHDGPWWTTVTTHDGRTITARWAALIDHETLTFTDGTVLEIGDIASLTV